MSTMGIIMKKIITIIVVVVLCILSYYCGTMNTKYSEDAIRKIINSRVQPDIEDDSPSSFKEFILHNNTPVLLEKLYKNLDDESKKNLDAALLSILHVPDKKYSKYYYFDYVKFDDDFMSPNDKERKIKYEKELPIIKNKYKLAKIKDIPYGSDVLYDEHNLRFANDKIKNYIKDKIFIDGGAHIGDSVLVLYKYQPKIIYSFDITEKHKKHYLETMKLNNIPSDKYKFIKLALADKKDKYKIAGHWEGEGIYNLKPLPNDAIDVYSTDLDSFLEENNKDGTKIGFIKTHIQGAMHQAIKGMSKTISKNRPILFFDISDSPQDFFYVKPILDDITKDLNYTIKITKSPEASTITKGLSIWAYPKELDE